MIRRASLTLLLFLVLPFPSAGAVDAHVLVLGRISDDPMAHYEQLKPLLDYVVPRMESVGIREGRILMARDSQQMASYIRRGRVDWITETVGSGMLLADRVGARPLLLTEREGEGRYHTVFFARADSGITGIDSLRGKRIAFQRTSSTSAYFVPAGQLVRSGEQLDILFSPRDNVSADAVGYLFARSELNIATWVHKGLADVGVMSNLDWNNPARMPEAFKSDLKLIARSASYPRAMELVRGDLDVAVRERLSHVLIEAANDPLAGPALHQFFGTTGFMPIDSDSQHALEGLQKLVRLVREKVE